MRFSRNLALFIGILSAFAAISPARAVSSLSHWAPWHNDGVDYRRLYSEDGKTSLPSQWEFDSWKPEDWTQDRGSEKAVMDGLYATGIVRQKSHDNNFPFFNVSVGPPILIVGPGFLKLSDRDKRRVIIYVAKAWGVSDDGMMHVNYADGDPLFREDSVGLYSKGAAQLQ